MTPAARSTPTVRSRRHGGGWRLPGSGRSWRGRYWGRGGGRLASPSSPLDDFVRTAKSHGHGFEMGPVRPRPEAWRTGNAYGTRGETRLAAGASRSSLAART